MSHVSCIETTINDLAALKQAAESLGLEFVSDQTTFRWYGNFVNDYHAADAAYKHGYKPEDYGKCKHAIRVPGSDSAYEVGVIEKADGTYGVIFDNWNGGHGLVEKIGKKGEKLNQAYTQAKIQAELTKKGFKLVKHENLANGSVKLTLKGPIKL